MKNNLFLCLTALSVIFFSQRLHASDFEIAENYLASYSNFNIKEMETYYSEDATFQDLTSEAFGKHAFILTGRDNIIEKFSSSFFQEKFRLKYKFIEKFEASGHHVFISEVISRTTKKDKIKYSCASVVSIIKIVDEKVISHIDYADYDGFKQSSKNKEATCSEF